MQHLIPHPSWSCQIYISLLDRHGLHHHSIPEFSLQRRQSLRDFWIDYPHVRMHRHAENDISHPNLLQCTCSMPHLWWLYQMISMQQYTHQQSHRTEQPAETELSQCFIELSQWSSFFYETVASNWANKSLITWKGHRARQASGWDNKSCMSGCRTAACLDALHVH